MKKDPYTYNHFVPKYIVNNFGTRQNNGRHKISICDYRNEKIIEEYTDEIFGVDQLYDDDSELDKKIIEKTLNTKIEQKFLHLYKKIVECKSDSIDLSNSDINEIKRFFLSEFVRLPPEDIKEKGWERYFDDFKNEEYLKGSDSTYKYLLKKYYPDREFIDDYLLADKEKMLKNLKIIINNSFENIIKDENCTVSLAKLLKFVDIGDIGIWRVCSEDNFLITDSYLISEWPNPSEDRTRPLTKNEESLRKLIKRFENDEERKTILLNRLSDLLHFPENIYFMPLSSEIIIVLLNPLFRYLFQGDLAMFYREIIPSTLIADFYLYPIYSRDKQSKTIEIQQLNYEITGYVNALMLNEIENYFGFRDHSKVIRSLEFYHKRAETTKFDYKHIIEIIKNENRDVSKM